MPPYSQETINHALIIAAIVYAAGILPAVFVAAIFTKTDSAYGWGFLWPAAVFLLGPLVAVGWGLYIAATFARNLGRVARRRLDREGGESP